jgi:hypothetical protein
MSIPKRPKTDTVTNENLLYYSGSNYGCCLCLCLSVSLCLSLPLISLSPPYLSLLPLSLSLSFSVHPSVRSSLIIYLFLFLSLSFVLSFFCSFYCFEISKWNFKLTSKSPPQIIGISSKVRPPMAAKIESGRFGKAGHENEGFWRSMIST